MGVRDTQLRLARHLAADLRHPWERPAEPGRLTPAGTHWFVPLQPLWRVERTFAWLGRNRRLRHDYEATVTSSQTFAHAAAVAFMLNRLYPSR